MASTELPELVVSDSDAWREWLVAHHEQPTGVWLVLAKKGTTFPTTLRYDLALKEALCQGWIDRYVAMLARGETAYPQKRRLDAE